MVASMAAGFKGEHLKWQHSFPGSGTTFETWASADSEGKALELLPNTVFNCWEVILFAAYKAGVLPWEKIHDVYTYHADDWNKYLAEWLTDRSGVYYDVSNPTGSKPQRGDIVLFNGVAHVALATGERDAQGRAKVISFWPPSDKDRVFLGMKDKDTAVFAGEVQETTIEELVQFMTDNDMGSVEVKFASPPW
jgi:hypothetical protein